jgi:RNA polymerase sigma factor for flagellar operon FliA
MLAATLYAKRHCDDFEFGDYLQFATVGLIEAIDRFNPQSTASFRTYATKWITGTVLDGAAHLSDRQEQINTRQRLRAERRSSRGNGVDHSDDTDVFEKLAEIAMGLAMGYILEDTTLYLDEEREQQPSQYDSVAMQQLRQRMAALVEQLPERERLLVKYHYFNQVPFETVAEQWNLTRGRISQIHRRALERLREASLKIGTYDVAW